MDSQYLGPCTCINDLLWLILWWNCPKCASISYASFIGYWPKCFQVHGYDWNIHSRNWCNVFKKTYLVGFVRFFLWIFIILLQVVDSLLDITRTPRKPQYKMAPELPLILRSCLFDKANFMCSSGMPCYTFFNSWVSCADHFFH